MGNVNKVSYQPNICIIGLNGNEKNNNINAHGTLYETMTLKRLDSVIKRMYFPLVNKKEPIRKSFYVEALEFINAKSTQPVIVFIIADFTAARDVVVRNYIDELRKTTLRKKGVFVYNIIFDMLREFERFRHKYLGEKMGSEKEAFDMEALPCFCNCARFSPGGYKRLVELIFRITGLDLLEPSFPNYSWETLSLIARHINRENFNSSKLRTGAIPKHGYDTNGTPLITEELIGVFDSNIEAWASNRPKLIEIKAYKCPHCECQINPRFKYWDADNEIIQCAECEGLVDASEFNFPRFSDIEQRSV